MSIDTADTLRDEVRRCYAEAAQAVTQAGAAECGAGSCCGDGSSPDFGEALYPSEERRDERTTALWTARSTERGYKGQNGRERFARGVAAVFETA